MRRQRLVGVGVGAAPIRTGGRARFRAGLDHRRIAARALLASRSLGAIIGAISAAEVHPIEHFSRAVADRSCEGVVLAAFCLALRVTVVVSRGPKSPKTPVYYHERP